jgi:hypothetical protein
VAGLDTYSPYMFEVMGNLLAAMQPHGFFTSGAKAIHLIPYSRIVRCNFLLVIGI